jgi:hypothetical protein
MRAATVFVVAGADMGVGVALLLRRLLAAQGFQRKIVFGAAVYLGWH